MEAVGNVWLEGAYYIDTNDYGELRIVGPGNHLLLGSSGLQSRNCRIMEVIATDHEVQIQLQLNLPERFIADPAMGHIRRVRQFIQSISQRELSFTELALKNLADLSPQQITAVPETDGTAVTYVRTYGQSFYGTRWQWPAGVTLERDPNLHGFQLAGTPLTINVTITTTTNVHPARFRRTLWCRTSPQPSTPLLDQTAAEINHLVSNSKTSGFDYGTVFPRDWIETADLLEPELTPAAYRFFYTESLRHVSDDGAGWHEDIVGEFRYEREQELRNLRSNLGELVGPDSPYRQRFEAVMHDLDELFVTRQMIDIEPHYILGLRHIDPSDFDTDSLVRLRRVSRYLVTQADSHNLITFKQLAQPFRRQRGDEYYDSGNWRDSTLAFQRIDPVIAPFDVNAVFYPQALRQLRRHHQVLGLDAALLDRLIHKWDRTKAWYRFTNPDGLTGYALALYGTNGATSRQHGQRLAVNHLDESYDLFYGTPSETDVASFAQRLLSPNYFRTKSGPTLVGHNDGYDHSQYHGDVIWAKQVAFTADGLARQLKYGCEHRWAMDTLKLIDAARLDVADTTLHAFTTLGHFPEVHYDDHGQARLYTDQPAPEGLMNRVQLWSAAAARRLYANHQ